MEIWKDIPGYEGCYKISTFGNVMSLRRPKVKEDRLIEPFHNTEGYKTLKLTKEGKSKTMKLHKVMAITFLNHVPCGFKEVVDHIDSDKNNNKLSNLQLISQRDNCIKSRKNNYSKFTGVSLNRLMKKHYASIKINNKTIALGLFNCETRAHLSYLKASQLINKFTTPIEFRNLINNSINNKNLSICLQAEIL